MLIDEIADYLEDAGLGVVGTTLFVGFLPAEPDACTIVFATGGQPPDARLPYDNPSFQIRTRGATQLAAHDRAMNALDALHALTNTSLPGGSYLLDCTAQQSSPAALGNDEAGRSEYTVNFRARVRRATSRRPL